MAIQTIPITTVSETITYTSTNNTAVTFMSLCNYEAVDVVCDIHVISPAAVAAPGNLLIKQITIVPGDTYILYHGNEKIVLSDTDVIRVVTASGGAVGLTVITSYMEV